MKEHRALVKETQQYIGWAYHELNWLEGKRAERRIKKRNALLNKLGRQAQLSFAKNKLHVGLLSEGCECCGHGVWSCIYLTQACPATCFYCPQQKHLHAPRPIADRLHFISPHDYVRYLQLFSFRGVGFSGGDPLASFSELLRYLRTLRKSLRSLYIWIYTSGMLVTEQKLQRLHQYGLDEIRFDIASTGYDVSPLKLAAQRIKTVTVEIPAIPEDLPKLKKLLPTLESAGVRHLNLHELSTTSANYRAFMKRGYTFLHRPNVNVLESEETALKVLDYALRNHISIPINYCTGTYKRRIQGAAARRRAATQQLKPYEEITKAGYIRTLIWHDRPERLQVLVSHLRGANVRSKYWSYDKAAGKLYLHPEIQGHMRIGLLEKRFVVEYSACFLTDCEEEAGPLRKEIPLSTTKRFFADRTVKNTFSNISMLQLKCLFGSFREKLSMSALVTAYAHLGLTSSVLRRFLELFREYEEIESGFAEVF